MPYGVSSSRFFFLCVFRLIPSLTHARHVAPSLVVRTLGDIGVMPPRPYLRTFLLLFRFFFLSRIVFFIKRDLFLSRSLNAFTIRRSRFAYISCVSRCSSSSLLFYVCPLFSPLSHPFSLSLQVYLPLPPHLIAFTRCSSAKYLNCIVLFANTPSAFGQYHTRIAHV